MPSKLQSPFTLPEWLEKRRVPDILFAQAYENCPPKCRAALKTGFALADFVFRQQGGMAEKHELVNTRLGFTHQSRRKPLLWTALIFDAENSAPARICAAAILPILANVPHIFALAYGARYSPPLLTALELCGLTDLFLLDYAEILELFNSSPFSGLKSARNGKIIIFYDYDTKNEFSKLDSSFQISWLPANANIKVLEPDSFDPEILSYTLNLKEFNGAFPLDCVLTDSDKIEDTDAPLVLHPGCEGFWLYPNLEPANFMKIRNAMYLHAPD